jgi:hypothetical protein
MISQYFTAMQQYYAEFRSVHCNQGSSLPFRSPLFNGKRLTAAWAVESNVCAETIKFRSR